MGNNRGSPDARAVSRGLKQKEYEDKAVGCLGILSFIPAVFLGVLIHWIVGIIVWLVLVALIGSWYWKE